MIKNSQNKCCLKARPVFWICDCVYFYYVNLEISCQKKAKSACKWTAMWIISLSFHTKHSSMLLSKASYNRGTFYQPTIFAQCQAANTSSTSRKAWDDKMLCLIQPLKDKTLQLPFFVAWTENKIGIARNRIQRNKV